MLGSSEETVTSKSVREFSKLLRKQEKEPTPVKTKIYRQKPANCGSIHSLYQDLYLTDLKNDIGELDIDLQQEKQRNLELS